MQLFLQKGDTTFFKKILSGNFFGNFQNFRKISDRKLSGKVFRKIVGNFFGRRPVRKPPKIPLGLFRKTGGDFSSEFALETGVFSINFGGKFRWFPYGSR